MIAAVDPGAKGAIAFVEDGYLIAVHDMPVCDLSGKPRVSAASLADILGSREVRHCYIEQVAAMPKQGSASTFAFGYAAGMVEGVCAGLGIAVTRVSPRAWKTAMKLTSDKEVSRARALQLWPGMAAQFARKRDEGRAEAALLGRWADAARRQGVG